MAHFWSDNVHTSAFTPRDYQVELLAAAREKNIILCLGHNSSKEFIALKLIQEQAYELRRSDTSDRKYTIYLCNESNGESMFNLVFHLTDLRVVNLNGERNVDWDRIVGYQVVILNPTICLDALVCCYLDIVDTNLIIIEDCHNNRWRQEVDEILRYSTDSRNRNSYEPRILGLAGPLHSAGCPLGRLGAELEYLEKSLKCKAESASDIVTVLRYCSKPKEIILQCAPMMQCNLTMFLRELIQTRMAFLIDHRFDPSEIYSDDFLEELQSIPDPKKDPIDFLQQYLDILDEMGPWCADRAALNLLLQIEKNKVKTPYERHFLLLCMISTTFVQIRAHCDDIFGELESTAKQIEMYSSPKVLRLLETLRLFRPPQNKVDEKPLTESNEKLIDELASIDFETLQGNIEQTCETVKKIDTPNDVIAVQKCLENIAAIDGDRPIRTGRTTESLINKSPIRQKFNRFRKRPPNQRTHRSHYNQNDPNALCGLLFCNSKFIAKILYSLLYEMSKCDPDLSYLGVQFTVDRVADPITEAKEAEIEHRKQEEVLKRFRMHDCNLLIGTSVLEEGIDLPKCNLVIRWDPPTTYRSYVQCKGRARATQAYHIILVAPHSQPTDTNHHFITKISDKSHRMICPPSQNLLIYDPATKSKRIESEEIADDMDGLNNVTHQELIEMYHRYACTISDDDFSLSNHDTLRTFVRNVEVMEKCTSDMVECLAHYMDIEKMLLRKCENIEPPDEDHRYADLFTDCILPYRPNGENGASVTLSTAISLVNKYCAKLPSDTFTKLTPLWRCARTFRNGIEMFQYTVRLPINSALKQDILGLPMPTRILARRCAALIVSKVLHQSGELDNNLQPIGKEGFRASEPDWENFELEKCDEEIVQENLEPRPGTTKRRQYYYKRIASVFSNCRPVVGSVTYLYHIKMTLECPIPEEQNTRGRKIYAPEDSPQGFGILTLKPIPKLSSFPIFTRSGEVKVALELSDYRIRLNEDQLNKINIFLKYIFTNVLRLQKYLMLYDPDATDNSFFIVPVRRPSNQTNVIVDWDFLNVISDNCERLPEIIPDEIRKSQDFDGNRFKDAVVMPWYRNQDQPQYFYVAEICNHLSPESSFPGESYQTFREYYYRKYNITIQNPRQPLLDVDHTSARLNFLTPRYVNRKGVALPTSSEETKRAKRENLEQKQILVPELCTIHPFPASLWRAAVCLPCILYRFNALLLADEIRKQVSFDLNLGQMEIVSLTFDWPTLDFGWSLAEVLKKSREAKAIEQKAIRVGPEETDTNEIEPPLVNGSNGKDSGDDETVDKDMLEIGTWTNDMALSNCDYDMGKDDDSFNEMFPYGINMDGLNPANIRYGSPTSWDALNGKFTNSNSTIIRRPDNFYSDSDASSDDDFDIQSTSSSDGAAQTGCLKIEFKPGNVAEAIETEEEQQKRQRQQEIINNINANEKYYQSTKNIGSGFDCLMGTDRIESDVDVDRHQEHFKESIDRIKENICSSESEMLVTCSDDLTIDIRRQVKLSDNPDIDLRSLLGKLIPFVGSSDLEEYYFTAENRESIRFSLDDLYQLNEIYFKEILNGGLETYIIEGTGSLFDQFNTVPSIDLEGKKIVNLNCQDLLQYKDFKKCISNPNPYESNGISDIIGSEPVVASFSFDEQPELTGHPGPSPSIILQALTMSNANDGINLERLETIGDSFLKYAITTYLYCTYENVHEGKLSHLRSKQVSNLNLYRLGRKKMLGESMIATKFEPHDNWLPPCYYVPKELEKALIEAEIPACHWNLADLPNIKEMTSDEICRLVRDKIQIIENEPNGSLDFNPIDPELKCLDDNFPDNFPCFIPYNLVTQHSIPDKSVADCVEALIGAYLIECGPRGALLFMAWLGIRVLPYTEQTVLNQSDELKRIVGSTRTYSRDNGSYRTVYGHWTPPKSPLLLHSPNPYETLEQLLNGYDVFETDIGYNFRDRSYLLQAMTHASYCPNRLTDCYQRLEFLGDAVLDYLITRHLYEDPRQHSPGALTDLRSALVNNTIFASLAVRHGFHKYFRHLSPGLNDVIDRFVRIQHENGHSISEEFYLLSEEECDEAEDVEVPKALGDVFESVAGAIFLDSNMSLDTVWKIYRNMMKPEIEQFSNSVPKSPIRELLELEPETAKFSKPEKLADGRRVRVTVEVFGKGTFRGIGRNYRIAKCTAAKCALRQLKKQGLISRKH